MYSIGSVADGCREAVCCGLGDIGAEEKSAIDKASPFRFESKNRIWESRRPQPDGVLVDVLESDGGTGGGSSDMLESSQKKDDSGAIRIQDPATLPHFEPPQRVWPQGFVASHTEHGRKKAGTGVYLGG